MTTTHTANPTAAQLADTLGIPLDVFYLYAAAQGFAPSCFD